MDGRRAAVGRMPDRRWAPDTAEAKPGPSALTSAIRCENRRCAVPGNICAAMRSPRAAHTYRACDPHRSTSSVAQSWSRRRDFVSQRLWSCLILVEVSVLTQVRLDASSPAA
jgi:hypothetical protein